MRQIVHISGLGLPQLSLADGYLGAVLQDENLTVHAAHMLHIDDDAVMTFHEAVIRLQHALDLQVGDAGLYHGFWQMDAQQMVLIDIHEKDIAQGDVHLTSPCRHINALFLGQKPAKDMPHGMGKFPLMLQHRLDKIARRKDPVALQQVYLMKFSCKIENCFILI